VSEALVGLYEPPDGFSTLAYSYTFHLRGHEDMMERWNDIKMLCMRYFIASEQIPHSGPVEMQLLGTLLRKRVLYV